MSIGQRAWSKIVLLQTLRPLLLGLEEVKMQKYKCTVCGYIYDPEKGDLDGGISPNTPYEKLPMDWVCPACGAPKDMFEEI
jgi:rubredoxin